MSEDRIKIIEAFGKLGFGAIVSMLLAFQIYVNHKGNVDFNLRIEKAMSAQREILHDGTDTLQKLLEEHQKGE